MCRGQMLGACNDLLCLTPHFHCYDVGFSTFAADNSNSTVISPVGHAFVHRWLEQDCDFFAGLVYSQDSAQSNLSAFTGFLP